SYRGFSPRLLSSYRPPAARSQGESQGKGEHETGLRPGQLFHRGERGAMRLATIQTASGPRAALFDSDSYVDLRATDPTLPPSVREVLALESDGLREVAQVSKAATAVRYKSEAVRLMAPIVDPPKIVCLGLNYRDHAAETGAKLPKDPILFSK